MQDRFRGQMGYGKVITNQLDHLSSSPMATPTITFTGHRDTAGGAAQFIFTITMNREGFGDTDGVALAKRAAFNYHVETTAQALIDGATFAGAAAATSTSATAAGTVIPNSTVAGGYHVGRVVCSSTGVVTLALTGTSGGGTTGVLVLTLPHGVVATSSQVAFSTA